MKKRIALFLAAAILLTLFGCASTSGKPQAPGIAASVSSPTTNPTAAALHDAPPTEVTTMPSTAVVTEATEVTEAVETTVSEEATKATEVTEVTEATDSTVPTEGTARDYVLNTNTRKFHYPSCNSAARISAKNRKDFHGTREEIIQMGYDPCKNCNP